MIKLKMKNVVLLAIVGCMAGCSSAWADGVTLTINSDRSVIQNPSTPDVSELEIGSNDHTKCIGVRSGSMGSQIAKIVSGTGITMQLYGIRSNNSAVTSDSITGGIELESTGKIYAVEFRGNKASEITGLGFVKAKSSNVKVVGIRNYYVATVDNTVSFAATDSYIIVNSSAGEAYGIESQASTLTVKGGTTDKTYIKVTGASGKDSAAVLLNGGNVSLEDFDLAKGKRKNAVTVNATKSGTLTLTDSILGGKVQGGDNLTIKFAVDSVLKNAKVNSNVIELDDGVNLTLEGKNKLTKGFDAKDNCVEISQAANSVLKIKANYLKVGGQDQVLFNNVSLADAGDFTVADSAKLKLIGKVKKWKYYRLVSGDAVGNGLVTPADLWTTGNIVNTKDQLRAYAEAGKLIPEYVVDGNSLNIEIRNIASVVEANTSGLAAVQQGTFSMVNQVADAIGDNLSLSVRPVKDKNRKTVWASYIYAKEKTDGMKFASVDRTGSNSVNANNTIQFRGGIVGVDLLATKKAVAGVALTYAKGEVHGIALNTPINNDAKYYGISFYDRVTNGNTALIYDLGYSQSKNDISEFACEEITADVKTSAYTAGARAERAFALKGSVLAPFASVRYVRLQNKAYTNSNGAEFETDNQNLFVPKVGLGWSGDYAMSKCDWRVKPVVEVGYLWNLGNRETKGTMDFNSRNFHTAYDIADKDSFYSKFGLEFNRKNFALGVAYRYMNGDKVNQNRLYFNANLTF